VLETLGKIIRGGVLVLALVAAREATAIPGATRSPQDFPPGLHPATSRHLAGESDGTSDGLREELPWPGAAEPMTPRAVVLSQRTSFSAKALRADDSHLPLQSKAWRKSLLGSTAVLALRIAFADKPGHVPSSCHDSLLFDSERSLRRYFLEASEGKLQISGQVLPADGGWFRLEAPLAAYGSDTGPNNADPAVHDRGLFSPDELVRHAVELADPITDFSQYDLDGDGAVDHLLIIHAGDDQATSRCPQDLWSRQIALGEPQRVDGVRIETAMIVVETSPLGTFCHEFAHDLGAPDVVIETGPQDLCLMSLGCWSGDPPGSEPAMLCAYLRWDLDGDPSNGREGWIAPEPVEPGERFTVGHHPVLVNLPDASLLLEYRSTRGPLGKGSHHRIIAYRISTDSWSLWPGQSWDSPAEDWSLALGQTEMELRVEATSEDAAVITSVLSAATAKLRTIPEGLQLVVYPNPFRTSTTLLVDGAEPTEVEIFDLAGHLIGRLTASPPGTMWDGRDELGRPLPSGRYLLRCRRAGISCHTAITILR